VYGSLLQGRLGAPADRILGGSFPNLPLAA
jgi:hypothetical protein